MVDGFEYTYERDDRWVEDGVSLPQALMTLLHEVQVREDPALGYADLRDGINGLVPFNHGEFAARATHSVHGLSDQRGGVRARGAPAEGGGEERSTLQRLHLAGASVAGTIRFS